MSARHAVTLALIAVQCTAMAVMTDSYAYPLVMAALALLAPLVPKRISMAGRTAGVLSLGMGAILLIYSQRTAYQATYTMWFPTYAMAVAFGRFFLFLQVLIVARSFQRKHTPVVTALLPFLAILVMTCIGNVSSLSIPAGKFRLLSLLFAALIAAYFASSLRHSAQGKTRAHVLRWTLNLGFMGVALSVAVIVGAAVQRYGNELDRLLGIAAGPSVPSVTAFSGRARLDNMTRLRNSGGTKIALRIEADNPPGYMRGIAYDTYSPPEWRVTGEVDALIPAKSPPSRLLDIASDKPWYSVREDGSTAWKPQIVWRAGRLEGALFAPLDTSWIGTNSIGIALDPQGIVRAESIRAEFINALSGRSDSRPLSESMRASLTKLPDEIDPRVCDLSRQLTQGLETDAEKIAAVLRYFQDYAYATDIRIPAASDPLVYFLLEKPPAHCEFFAAGATVLLRASGVPARYITGFLVTERNALGSYWCARNRDAHAWCEAYDRLGGWITVDATPPSGRPSGEAATRVADLWDGMRFYGGRALNRATEVLQYTVDRFPEFARGLASHLASPRWVAALLTAGLFAGLFLVLRRRNRKRAMEKTDAFADYHRLLNAMDRRLAKAGLRRDPSETLERFCGRILASPVSNVAAIVAWYRAYMRARYGAGPTEESIDALQRTLPVDSAD